MNNRDILRDIFKNENLRRIIFQADRNQYKEEYLRILEEYKKPRTIENEAMIEYILQDEERTKFVLDDIVGCLLDVKFDGENKTIDTLSPEVKQRYSSNDDKKAKLTPKKKLTKIQQKVFDKIEEFNYDLSQREIAIIMGEAPSNIYQRIIQIDKKGYEVREKMRRTKKGQDVTHEKRLIEKFINLEFEADDAKRVANFIKHNKDLVEFFDKVEASKKISYSNMDILMDELLQDEEEDKTAVVDFAIEYARILIERGTEHVDDQFFQIFVKHNVTLNQKQGNRIKELMDLYEQQLKQENKETNPTVPKEAGIVAIPQPEEIGAGLEL